MVLKLSVGGAAEAETLGRLAHPNVVPVFSVGEDPAAGLTVVCMPFLGTATLCDVLDRAGLGSRRSLRASVVLEAARQCRGKPASADLNLAPDPLLVAGDYVDGVLHLGVQLAQALAFTHSKGVLHRDLKPSNVLLAPSGKPMLLDFNLSYDHQISGARVGATLPYAAPEQLQAVFPTGLKAKGPAPLGPRPEDRGAEAEQHTDPRSDLFSLGVILYELLTGDLPFHLAAARAPADKTVASLLAQQAIGPIAVRQRNPSVDPKAAAVVERCLRFEASERPASAEELATSLGMCLLPQRRLARWGRRNRASLAGAATLIAAILTVSGLLLANRDPYPLREFRSGAHEFAAGNYQTALGSLDHAVRAQPDDADFLFARGQTRQRLADFVGAAADFKAAADRSPAGIIRASLAYCRARSGSYNDAIDWGQRAIDAGFATAEVQNNLGHCFYRLRQLNTARQHLDEAIRLDPTMQAAYCNRAKVGLVESLKRASPAAAISDAETAIRLGPVTADLYFDAARLYVLDRKDPLRDETIVRYLAKALRSRACASSRSSRRIVRTVSGYAGWPGQLHRQTGNNPARRDDSSHSARLPFGGPDSRRQLGRRRHLAGR